MDTTFYSGQWVQCSGPWYGTGAVLSVDMTTRTVTVLWPDEVARTHHMSTLVEGANDTKRMDDALAATIGAEINAMLDTPEGRQAAIDALMAEINLGHYLPVRLTSKLIGRSFSEIKEYSQRRKVNRYGTANSDGIRRGDGAEAPKARR